MVLIFGLIAGLLQACGYITYIWKSLKHEINPNPITWLMFAYGTGLLTVLELDRDASWSVLLLPATCATLSMVVAFRCWQTGTLTWPKAAVDKLAFGADVVLTILYGSAQVASASNILPETQREQLVLAFLICSNLSTIVSFIPLMRGASQNEHPLPWFVWSVAYGTLAMVTAYEFGVNELLIYPASNTLLHAAVALLALPHRGNLWRACR